MFATKNFPPADSDGSSIVVSSLSPIRSAPFPLNFQTMYRQEYSNLKHDLAKSVSPQKSRVSRHPKPRALTRKKAIAGDENAGKHFEHTLYCPPTSKEFTLSKKVKHISPSELVLLRAKHADKMKQVELHASTVKASPKKRSKLTPSTILDDCSDDDSIH
jgi:hypothetical protein